MEVDAVHNAKLYMPRHENRVFVMCELSGQCIVVICFLDSTFKRSSHGINVPLSP